MQGGRLYRLACEVYWASGIQDIVYPGIHQAHMIVGPSSYIAEARRFMWWRKHKFGAHWPTPALATELSLFI